MSQEMGLYISQEFSKLIKENADIDGEMLIFNKFKVFFTLLSEIYIVVICNFDGRYVKSKKCLNLSRSIIISLYKTIDIHKELIFKKLFGNLFFSIEKLLTFFCDCSSIGNCNVEDFVIRNKNFDDFVKVKNETIVRQIERKPDVFKDDIWKGLEKVVIPFKDNVKIDEGLKDFIFGPSILTPDVDKREIIISTRKRVGEYRKKSEMKETLNNLGNENSKEVYIKNIANSSLIYDVRNPVKKIDRNVIPTLKNFKKMGIGEEKEVDYSIYKTQKKKKKNQQEDPIKQLATSPVIKKEHGLLNLSKIKKLPLLIRVNEEISAIFDSDKQKKYKLIGTIDVLLYNAHTHNFNENETISFMIKLLNTQRVGKFVTNPKICKEVRKNEYKCQFVGRLLRSSKNLSVLKYQLIEGKTPLPIKLIPQVKMENKVLSVVATYKLNPQFSNLHLQLMIVPFSNKVEVEKERHKPEKLGKFDPVKGKLFWRIPPIKEPLKLLSQFMPKQPTKNAGHIMVKFQCKGSTFSQVKIKNEDNFLGKTEHVLTSGKYQINLPDV